MGSKCCPHIPITEPTQILNETYPLEDLQTTQRIENKIKSQNQKNNNKENKEIPKIQNQSNNNKNEKEENIKLKNSNQNIKNENFESPNSKEEKPEKQKVDSSGHLRKKQKNFFINEKEKDELKEDYEKSVLKIIQKHNRNNQDEEIKNRISRPGTLIDMDDSDRNPNMVKLDMEDEEKPKRKKLCCF